MCLVCSAHYQQKLALKLLLSLLYGFYCMLLNLLKRNLDITKGQGTEKYVHYNQVSLYIYFTITAEILARSLANFYRQYVDRHMNLKFVRRVSERELAIRPFVIVKNKLMSLSCYWQWISSSHCQSSLRIHSAIASWIHSYFDNVMTKFMINNRTDAWKTDVNLLNRGSFRYILLLLGAKNIVRYIEDFVIS